MNEKHTNIYIYILYKEYKEYILYIYIYKEKIYN